MEFVWVRRLVRLLQVLYSLSTDFIVLLKIKVECHSSSALINIAVTISRYPPPPPGNLY